MGKILRHSIFAAITGVAAAIVAVSCNTSGCTDNRSSLPLAEFYSSTTLDPIVLDSLEITGVGAPDSAILLSPGTQASQVHLPMRAMQSSTSWCFAYRWADIDRPENNDTVSFDYEALPYFASDDCGAMYRYRIRRLDYTTHLIDSIGIVDSLITNIDDVDIHIYFRTREADEQNARRHAPKIALR